MRAGWLWREIMGLIPLLLDFSGTPVFSRVIYFILYITFAREENGNRQYQHILIILSPFVNYIPMDTIPHTRNPYRACLSVRPLSPRCS